MTHNDGNEFDAFPAVLYVLLTQIDQMSHVHEATTGEIREIKTTFTQSFEEIRNHLVQVSKDAETNISQLKTGMQSFSNAHETVIGEIRKQNKMIFSMLIGLVVATTIIAMLMIFAIFGNYG